MKGYQMDTTQVATENYAQTVPSARFESVSELAKAEIQVRLLKGESFSDLREYVAAPFDVPTPKEKVKKRPDGFDYVESSWMDKEFKSHSPLYAYELLHYSEAQGWISVIVRLTNRISGNNELGGASVRIQVRQGSGLEPTFRDIIDKGNNVAAAVTRACKNAQSKFGHAADIYGKREQVRTEDEKKRYKELHKLISGNLSQLRADQFREGWDALGADFSEYLDSWERYITKITPKKPSAETVSDQIKGESVTEGESPQTIMFN